MFDRLQKAASSRAAMASALVLTLALGAGISSAGGGRHGPPSPEKHVEHLSEELELSDDQAVAIRAILEERQSEIDALRGSRRNGDLDRQAARQAVRASREETALLIEKVLDDDQVAAFQSLRERRKARHGSRKMREGEGEVSPSDESAM